METGSCLGIANYRFLKAVRKVIRRAKDGRNSITFIIPRKIMALTMI